MRTDSREISGTACIAGLCTVASEDRDAGVGGQVSLPVGKGVELECMGRRTSCLRLGSSRSEYASNAALNLL